MLQLSIVAENTKGSLFKITSLLANANINMNTLISNDSAEFGIVRMLVSDPAKALECLKMAGYICKLEDVTAVEISDHAGSLNALLELLRSCNVDILYIYVTYNSFSKLPVAILKVAESAEVEEVLTAHHYSLVNAIA